MLQTLQFLLTVLCSILFVMSFFISNQKLYNVTVVDKDAYWMYNNKLYTSKINDGKIDTLKKKKIDHMGMSEEDIHDILREIGSI